MGAMLTKCRVRHIKYDDAILKNRPVTYSLRDSNVMGCHLSSEVLKEYYYRPDYHDNQRDVAEFTSGISEVRKQSDGIDLLCPPDVGHYAEINLYEGESFYYLADSTVEGGFHALTVTVYRK